MAEAPYILELRGSSGGLFPSNSSAQFNFQGGTPGATGGAGPAGPAGPNSLTTGTAMTAGYAKGASAFATFLSPAAVLADIGADAAGAAAVAQANAVQRANHTGTQGWSTLTGTPTTKAGYGITDVPVGSGTSTGTNTGDQTSVTGNAGTATALATGRAISITGDVAYTSPAFDGTTNVTAAGTLASIIVAGGPVGSSSVVPVITYDAKGRLTAVTTATITPASIGAGTGNGSVTTVSVVSANGFAGTVATATSTPSITVSTSVSGLLKGNGTAILASVAGTDYSAGTSGLVTGILKSTTVTGVLSVALSSDFPVLNQNTTGSAATLTTPRAINGVSFDGSAAITVSAAAGTLTGATLAAGVTASALLSAGGGTFGTAAFTASSAYATSAQGVTTLALTTPGVIFGTPINFTNAAGAWSGTLALASQAANTVFGNFTGASAAPTFAAAPTFSGANLTNLPAAAAGTLTGATLASNVLASSLTSVGALTGGSTGAGFTVALSTATITGTLADAQLSSNVPLKNAANTFTVGGQLIQTAAGVVGLQIDGAASPTADLFKVRKGTLNAFRVGPTGDLYFGELVATGTVNIWPNNGSNDYLRIAFTNGGTLEFLDQNHGSIFKASASSGASFSGGGSNPNPDTAWCLVAQEAGYSTATVFQAKRGLGANSLYHYCMGQQSSTTFRTQGDLTSGWVDSTEATRTAYSEWGVFYTTARRVGVRIQATSSAVNLGLYGVTPVARSAGWSTSGVTTTKTLTPGTSTLTDTQNVLATLIEYLKTLGPLGA